MKFLCCLIILFSFARAYGEEINLNNLMQRKEGKQYANLFKIPQLADRTLFRQNDYLVQSITYNTYPLCCCSEFWADYDWGKTFLGTNSQGLDLFRYELSCGMQTDVNPCWLTGIATAYTHNDISIHKDVKGNNSTWQGALYAAYKGPFYYLFSDLVCGLTRSKLHRCVKNGFFEEKMHSKPRLTHGAWHAEIGTACLLVDSLFVKPFIGCETGCYHLSRFSEHGCKSQSLSVHHKTVYVLDSLVGFHLMTQLPPICFEFTIDLAWRHACKSLRDAIAVHAHREEGRRLYHDALRIGSNSVEGAVGFNSYIMENLTLFGTFACEKRHKFESYDFTLGCIVVW